jgi:hypothetical protein
MWKVTYTNQAGEYCTTGLMKLSSAFDVEKELKAGGCVDVEIHEEGEDGE